MTRPLKYRRTQLLQVAHLIQDNWTALEDALTADYGRVRFETGPMELTAVFAHAIRAAQEVEEWTKPEKPKVEEWRAGWDTTIYPTPKGAVLIISFVFFVLTSRVSSNILLHSPWNAPYLTTFSPLIGAIAAGCTALVKPSELGPNASQLLADLFPKYFDANAYAIVTGAVTETTHLLELQWDHILYTGAPKIGRIVAAAAAKHLTPITLELGGKCPVLIDDDVDIDLVAKRVLYGKQLVAGQVRLSILTRPVFVYKLSSCAIGMHRSGLYSCARWKDGAACGRFQKVVQRVLAEGTSAGGVLKNHRASSPRTPEKDA